MSNSFLAFNNFIKKFVEISDAQIEDLNKKCEVVTFSKWHILMKAGEVQNSIFFF